MGKNIGLFIFLMLIYSSSLISAVDCPFDIVNESYPGSCGRYIDTNGDNLCDLSQETLRVQSLQIQDKTSFLKTISGTYNTIPIIFFSTLVYLFTFILVKKGKLSLINHRKIWNYLLLISFIFVALSSILYLLKVDFNFSAGSLSFISFWHIEIGIVMIVISIFHIFWHLYYYNLKKLLNKNIQS